ncbi:MAG: PilN domain-containing protein [Candidatus Moranbacteria bacterium]|nr:PilN domain-containing protein [Candidatus Moranbacteria bacterium]
MKILLNLLPEEKKRLIERGLHGRILLWQFFMLFLLELLFLGILITVGVLLSVELESRKFLSENSSLATQTDSASLRQYEDKFLGINEALGVVGKIQMNHVYFSQLFRVLDTTLPKEVLLKQMMTKDRVVTLIGTAETRENLLSFEEQLKKSSCIENVNVPLSNLFSQKNLDFQLDFTLTFDCLHKNQL